ncbi:hypothetical protein DGN16_13545 [Xanthomonas citri pv. fuscans]|uniref:hypothetical protein n=1 Tax=Xanthomonas citri TaxID=346 RepID=UPI0005960916|nr:hypothetical protein [Xanthomonas citri]KIJ01480.1 hypothetical protein ST33_08670 [Xanthomonas citri pv. fuscans]QWN04021.1 hypothetical protein DGN16_13545 [Xanthomonas citri pv. fuscans]
MHIRAVLVVLFVASVPASAQQVFKCVSGTQVVYQSAPCLGVTAKQWDAQPEPDNPALRQRLARTAAQLRARNASPVRSGSGTYVAASSSKDRYACEVAKEGRRAAYEAAGVHRSFALSSYWDNAVQDACK